MLEEAGQKLTRERREAIHKQLGQLRSVLADLQSHYPPADATFKERQDHVEAVEQAKDRIRQLDYEYVKLSS